jgi:iron complex transport system substrate-binding protein
MPFRISHRKLQIPAGWIAPALCMAFILGGCAKKNKPTTPVNAEIGPLRIVSMAPNLTEILFELGLDAEIVGVTKYSTYPAAAKNKPCVGTFWQPDVEAVMALRPTLLVNLWFDQQASLVSRMERIGCKTLTLRIETVEQLYDAIEAVGRAVDKQPEAQDMVRRLKDKQSAAAAHHAGRDRPKVLWVIQRYPFRVAGRQTFITELIKMAGGVNAIGETLTQYPPINIEEVIAAMPDVIIEPVMDAAQFEEQKTSANEFYRRYAAVPAVRDGRIYIIDGDLVSRLGPRLDEAADLIAECLWQE